jgi:hypothetical protein
VRWRVEQASKLPFEPGQLLLVERAVRAAVRVHRVEHDAVHGSGVEGVVGGVVVEVRLGEAVADRHSGGGEVLLDRLRLVQLAPVRVRGDRPEVAGDHARDRLGRDPRQVDGQLHQVGAVRKVDHLVVARGEGGAVREVREVALDQRVVVAVGAVPGQLSTGRVAQSLRFEGLARGVQQSGRGRESVAGARIVVRLAGLGAVGMPVVHVVLDPVGDALIALGIA